MAWCENIFIEWPDFKLNIHKWEFPDTGITCVFGESGSGKTTLLQVLAGLIPCPSFRLFLQGEYSSELPAAKRNISFVFQDYGLFPHMSVFENIAFAAESKRIPSSMWQEQAQKLIARLGLERLRHQKARTLSGGEQQRVALARALVTKPRMVCLDEPLSALDERRREEARLLISDLSIEFKVPFIFVSHDLRDVRLLGNSVLLMAQGQMIAAGATKEILNRPPSLAAARIISENQVIALAQNTDGLALRAVLDKTQIRRHPVEPHANKSEGVKSWLVAKPWSFEVTAPSHGLRAKVLRCIDEGQKFKVQCELAGGQTLSAWAATEVKPGALIDLKIDPGSLILFEDV